MLHIEEERKAHQVRLAEMEAEIHRGTQKIQEDSLAIASATQAVTSDLKAIMDRADHFTTKWTKRAFGLAAAGVLIVGLAYLFPDAGRSIGNDLWGALQQVIDALTQARR